MELRPVILRFDSSTQPISTMRWFCSTSSPVVSVSSTICRISSVYPRQQPIDRDIRELIDVFVALLPG